MQVCDDVLSGVCLLVSLFFCQQLPVKTMDRISVKILPEISLDKEISHR